jgi:hypothetical protein
MTIGIGMTGFDRIGPCLQRLESSQLETSKEGL